MKLLSFFSLLATLTPLSLGAQEAQSPLSPQNPRPEFTTAGFLPVAQSPRVAHDINVGWRYKKGDAPKASEKNFSDKEWEIVNLPHGLELVPEESSGCSNYQGPAWYRKEISIPAQMKGKRLTLYFEGIMGRSRVYVNGTLLKEHSGGYLPLIVDASKALIPGEKNTVAIFADNSNDASYPPGKGQNQLDFNYFGGIYRDAYLIETAPIHLTDANEEDEVAGGGVFFYTKEIQGKDAEIGAKVELANRSHKDSGPLLLSVQWKDPSDGEKTMASWQKEVQIPAGQKIQVQKEVTLKNGQFWSPDKPFLYEMHVALTPKGQKATPENSLDYFKRKVGVRTFTLNEKGFVLNGEPFSDKLIGGNRHQDFAYLGNALPNIGQWRDAQKLRKAGMRVVRSAHYPQDPAFMDAADELGLFVIVATPGWQFWNNHKDFENHVYSDIKNMVRRDRNHASVWVWEPILNETHYPKDFAQRAYETTHAEYPVGSCYAACDSREKGAELYDMLYEHPYQNAELAKVHPATPNKNRQKKAYFTREFGDNVDDWSSHNSPSRVARRWGEAPMLVQAEHYMQPSYTYTCWESLYQTSPQHLGGALWHPFDHQRGYHPDPFYGGIMDAFRQPKTSYYFFQAQRPRELGSSVAAGPMVHIAHEMTPFSSPDVTVVSNCDEVRLSGLGIKSPLTQKVRAEGQKRPAPSVTFKNVFNHMKDKQYARSRAHGESYFLAEGLINGQVVTSHKVQPARRAEQIRLRLDDENVPLLANGTDMVVVIAEVTDKNGMVKHLNNEEIVFSVEGDARLIGDEKIGANPRPVQWGSAPALLQMGEKAGKIRVSAHLRQEGAQKPQSGVLEFETLSSPLPALYEETPSSASNPTQASAEKASQNKAELQELKRRLEASEKELNRYKIKEVEKQQSDFE